MRLGSLAIDPPLFLAPMAGITDRDFRLIVRRIGGVGMVGMEFLPAKGLVAGDRRTLQLLHFSDEERPLSMQIYGGDPATLGAAARQVQALGPDAVDVNMGCPANQVLKGCAGAALMGDLDVARQIVAAVRREVRVPLTVKFRLGLDERRVNYVELARICEGEGADGVVLHARTARQMFRGEAAWEHVARLKAAVSIPVIGNGDVRAPEDAARMLRETGCDGVMIGRASMKNPWIYKQAAELLQGKTPTLPTPQDRHALIRTHFDMVTAQEEPGFALHKLRTFTGWYTHGLPDGGRLRALIGTLETPQAFLDAVDAYFSGGDMRTAA